jgi:hypothetical protein
MAIPVDLNRVKAPGSRGHHGREFLHAIPTRVLICKGSEQVAGFLAALFPAVHHQAGSTKNGGGLQFPPARRIGANRIDVGARR